jgi:MscS family membrane protein
VWANAQEATNAPAPRTHPGLIRTDVVSITTSLKDAVKLYCQDHPAAMRVLNLLSRNTLFDQPLWKYIASTIFILLAFYIAKLLDFIVNVWLKRLTKNNRGRYDDLILKLLRGPVKVVTFVVFLQVGLNIFDWPEKAQTYLLRGSIIVVAVSLTYLVLKIVDLLLGVWRERNISAQDRIFAEHLFPLIRKITKVLVITCAALVTAENLHIPITSLLAGLSVGGLALGLAAQDTIANLFGAVAIFLDKPFYIGDHILVEGIDGTVESIGMRSTRVRNLSGHHVTIPNKLMGNAIITNITRSPTVKTEMNFSLTYQNSGEKVKRATVILDEIFRAHPKTSSLSIGFNKFGGSALNVLVVHMWKGPDDGELMAELQKMNLQIKERFDAEKIEFAYPTQTLFLKSGTTK